MLVLSRKIGETFIIGEDVEVMVTQIGKGRVRLGISAPRNVEVRRGELPKLPDDAMQELVVFRLTS